MGLILSYTAHTMLGDASLQYLDKNYNFYDYNYHNNNSGQILNLNGSAAEPPDNISGNESVYPESHACSLFGSGAIPSAVSIWRKHLSEVVPSSRHSAEKKTEYLWHDFTARLLVRDNLSFIFTDLYQITFFTVVTIFPSTMFLVFM